MIRPTPVIKTHADYERNIDRIVRLLGRDKLRFRIFCLIYSRARRPKSVTQILNELHLGAGKRQLVLNQINFLAKHELIGKDVIVVSKGRGKEAGYSKIDFIMANKHEILRIRKKPELLKKSAPGHQTTTINIFRSARGASKRSSKGRRNGKLKVLYLTAAPASQPALRTEAEFRNVQREFRASVYRDRVQLFISPAADEKSILDGINDHRPQIIHFSGHGGGKGIWLDDGKMSGSVGRSMSFDLLAEALSATNLPPTLLVLNACNTLIGARVLLDAVKVVIGMSDSISDIGASTFAAQFYAAIASGQPISSALKQGRFAMKAAMLADADLPELIHRRGIDPKKLVLVGGR